MLQWMAGNLGITLPTQPEQASPSIVSDVLQWMAGNLGITLPTWEQLTGWPQRLWEMVVPGGVPTKFPPAEPIDVEGTIDLLGWPLTNIKIQLFEDPQNASSSPEHP